MFNRNEYMDQFLDEIMEPGEVEKQYFYVMSFAPLTNYLLFQEFTMLLNKHMIVAFTNKRILICEMDGTTGKMTGNFLPLDLQDVKEISFKRGLLKTTVKITFSDDSKIQIKPNNVCVGLSNHKKNLLALAERY
ncbi:hypothetical protein BC6307_01945 [Sutcliffiella cohnii]|uniref:YokE-like PH domain-containing protein n=1 Tax=Sutcliffiella cohnii TaxID=33932 RepID=A0A223KKX6_9BACI|nr:PH domain-containing protein [Sutcliffiella cohnii]AST90131.1 hypothetical protein BC6307_01945 [Sutcliffiella cohnii]